MEIELFHEDFHENLDQFHLLFDGVMTPKMMNDWWFSEESNKASYSSSWDELELN